MTQDVDVADRERGLERDEGRKVVVIIGGGFGGLNVAKRLRGVDVDVYLIDRHNYHLFQPLLYQVATAGLGVEDIASPIRTILRRHKNAKVIMGEVTDIDRKQRLVHFDHGTVEYDYLVVAAGMETNYFGNKESWEKLAPGLKTLNDAVECRRRILRVFERAEWTQDDEWARALLTFVIIGAGPTGVEMAGAIRDIAHEVMVRDFRNIDSSKAKVILIDAGPAVLAGYEARTSERARQDLEEMGVEVRLNSMVEEITAEGVRVGEEFIRAETVIWAAGVRASGLGESLDTELDRLGRVIVNEDLTVPDDDRVFIIGDLAHFEDPRGEPLPGLAPVAIQQGHHVAYNIRYALRGERYRPFEYNDKGKMATLGRARAVAEFQDRQFFGFFAWFLWLFVHLLFLIGFRNRVFVMLDWFYAYVGMRRSARLIMKTPQEVQEPPERARLEEEIDQISLIAGQTKVEQPAERRRSGGQGGGE